MAADPRKPRSLTLRKLKRIRYVHVCWIMLHAYTLSEELINDIIKLLHHMNLEETHARFSLLSLMCMLSIYKYLAPLLELRISYTTALRCIWIIYTSAPWYK